MDHGTTSNHQTTYMVRLSHALLEVSMHSYIYVAIYVRLLYAIKLF